EVEGPVLVHGDLDRDDVATLRLGRGVVRLAELHDVDAVLAEGGAHRRSRVRLTGLDLKLDDPGELLLLGGHLSFLGVGVLAVCKPRVSRTRGAGRTIPSPAVPAATEATRSSRPG